MPRTKGAPALRLEQEIHRMLQPGGWNPSKPLPVTRELAGEFQVSNVTVHRIFRRLSEEGLIWRSDTGRYFIPSGRESAKRPKPVGCLIRELETWTASYRLILQGFSTACAQTRRSLIIPSGVGIVRHATPEKPPAFARREAQSKTFRHLLQLDQKPHGWLLDHLWDENVIEQFEGSLRNAVLVWRPTRIDSVSSVSVDFDSAARLVLEHFAGRGIARILMAVPFHGDSAVDAMIRAVEANAPFMGFRLSAKERRAAGIDIERAALVEELRSLRRPVGLFCAEDNVSRLLMEGLRAAGVSSPERVEIVSGMGTEIATGAGLSTLQLPFHRIGEEAARLINERRRENVVLPCQFVTSGGA